MKSSLTANLWLTVFFLGTIFQYWRGSQVDTLVFATVTALLLLASHDLLAIPKLAAVSLKASIPFLLVSTIVFIFVHIHNILGTVFYLGMVPLLFGIIWRSDSQRIEPLNPAMRRTSWIWFSIGVLTCLAELGNYFAADVTHNDKLYPTITVLVDPLVANNAGKILFVVLWSMIGVGLLRVSTKR